jgi:WD40 repeat protein
LTDSSLNNNISWINLSFSPNNRLIASTEADSINDDVKLWSLDGKQIKTFPRPMEGGGSYGRSHSDLSPSLLGFTRDGQRIAIARFYDNYNNYKNYNDNNYNNVVYAILYNIDTGNTAAFPLIGHKNKVTSFSFTSDGQMLASASQDKTVKLWSLDRRNFTNFYDYNQQVTNVSFSPDGQLLASVSQDYSDVLLWQRNGTLITNLPGNNSQISFSADSQMLASASQDNTVQLWRQNGTFLKTLQGEVIDGSFSPEGETIALVRSDNSVELSSSDGKAIATLKGHKDRVYKISFSRDGKTLATASKDNTIKLWRRDATLITTLKAFGNEIKDIGLSRNGETLAILSDDNTVKFLRQNGKVINTFKSDEISMSFSPDQEIVAISKRDHSDKNNVVKLWRINGTFLTTLQPQGKSRSHNIQGFTRDSQTIVTSNEDGMQFWRRDGSLLATLNKKVTSSSPDFQTLVTIEGNNNVKLWKRDGTLIRTIKVKSERADQENNYYGNNYYYAVSFSPDGKTLAIRTNKDTVELWRTDGTFLKIFQGLSDGEIERFGSFSINHHMIFSLDSQTLAMRTGENTVQFWGIDGKASTQVPLQIIKGRGNWIDQVRSIPNREIVAIVGGDDTVKFWQLPHEVGEEFQLLKTFQGHSNLVTSVSISPDGKMIASASKDKTVKLWRRRDGTLFKNFTEHKDKVNSVTFSPDSQLIASTSDDKTVKIWRPDGTVIKSFEEHGNAVTSVSFSPNAKRIASVSKDNTVKIWSVNGKERKSIKTIPTDEQVLGVSFHPDSQWIALAGEKTVKLWSIDSTSPITLERFGSKDVSFSPDGKSIAAAGDDGVSVWNFDLNELLKRGCDTARDYLKNNPKVQKSDRTLCDDIK